MEQKQMVIQVDKLQFSWQDDSPHLLDIDELSVPRKERIFIKGASGSGKSTLLGLLGGVITPQRGRINVLDTEVNMLSSSRRDAFRADHIGFIFQMFNLIPYLSLVENIILPCCFSRSRRQRVLKNNGSLAGEAVRLLSHLGLEGDELLSRPVTELSMGQQQRVAAARALIGSPDILIADEPTSSLDADSRESFLELLFNECRSEEITLVFVSHDASLEPMFDRTIELHDINRAAPEVMI